MNNKGLFLLGIFLSITYLLMTTSCASYQMDDSDVDGLDLELVIDNVETEEEVDIIVHRLKGYCDIDEYDFDRAQTQLKIYISADNFEHAKIIHSRIITCKDPPIGFRDARARIRYYTLNIRGEVTIILRSRVTPGARLFIRDQEVDVAPDGSFVAEIRYNPKERYIKAMTILGETTMTIWIPIDNTKPILELDPSL